MNNQNIKFDSVKKENYYLHMGKHFIPFQNAARIVTPNTAHSNTELLYDLKKSLLSPEIVIEKYRALKRTGWSHTLIELGSEDTFSAQALQIAKILNLTNAIRYIAKRIIQSPYVSDITHREARDALNKVKLRKTT